MRSESRYQAAIFVMPARGSVHATFDEVWRQQFDAFDLGDTVVHYRARIKSGLVVHYMGRFFTRKARVEGALKNYAVLYLIDLGGGRVQPVTALVEPFDPSVGMSSSAAHGQLGLLPGRDGLVGREMSAALRRATRPVAEFLRSTQEHFRRVPETFRGRTPHSLPSEQRLTGDKIRRLVGAS